MSAPPAYIEPKNDVAHFDRHDTLVAGTDNQTVVGVADGSGEKTKAGKALGNTAPKDGNLGAKWLATYTGPRPELTDELNSKIRNRIDSCLLPVIFLIYFSELHLNSPCPQSLMDIDQQQDKSSVAFAAVFGELRDTVASSSISLTSCRFRKGRRPDRTSILLAYDHHLYCPARLSASYALGRQLFPRQDTNSTQSQYTPWSASRSTTGSSSASSDGRRAA